jgi:DNA-binding transcriptional ArsR family regulator
MRDLLQITKALADESRLRLLLALRGGELCACQLTELLGLAPSTVSRHLALLTQAGLVHPRKDGRWMYFTLPGPEAPPAVREALDWMFRTLARTPRATADATRLRAILKEDPTQLCKRQCRS